MEVRVEDPTTYHQLLAELRLTGNDCSPGYLRTNYNIEGPEPSVWTQELDRFLPDMEASLVDRVQRHQPQPQHIDCWYSNDDLMALETSGSDSISLLWPWLKNAFDNQPVNIAQEASRELLRPSTSANPLLLQEAGVAGFWKLKGYRRILYFC